MVPDDRRRRRTGRVSGPALLLGLADFVVMTERSYAFVNGPVMVEEFTGVGVDNDELGGPANLARYTGVASVVVADRDAAVESPPRSCSPTSPTTSTSSRRCGRATIRPTDSAPRRAS